MQNLSWVLHAAVARPSGPLGDTEVDRRTGALDGGSLRVALMRTRIARAGPRRIAPPSALQVRHVALQPSGPLGRAGEARRTNREVLHSAPLLW